MTRRNHPCFSRSRISFNFSSFKFNARKNLLERQLRLEAWHFDLTLILERFKQSSLGCAPVDPDHAPVLFDHHVTLEAGQAGVLVELGAGVGGLCALGQHFDDEARILEEVWIVSGGATDHYIGVAIPRVFNAKLDCLELDSAFFGPSDWPQCLDDVRHDVVVLKFLARHRQQFTIDVLVPKLAGFLEFQVRFHIDGLLEFHFEDLCHVGIVLGFQKLVFKLERRSKADPERHSSEAKAFRAVHLGFLR
jgi:hypothetical protein